MTDNQNKTAKSGNISMKKICLDILNGRPQKIVPFCPDISDWYKVKRLPVDQAGSVFTGSFIADDLPMHKNNYGMPDEFGDWTYLDFYRNFGWALHVHIYDWCDFKYENCEFSCVHQDNQIIKTIKTPLGSLRHVDIMAAEGSFCPSEHFIKQASGWKIMSYFVKHSVPVPKPEHIKNILNGIGELGVADIVVMRSPFGKVIQEYAGLQATAYQLFDYPDVIDEFLEIQEALDLKVLGMAADCPGDIVILSDHADEQLINPMWYETYCVPFYRKAAQIVNKKGKLLSTHLDGKFKGLFNGVRNSQVNVLDGCTPAPMTNYEVEELAKAMPQRIKAYVGVPSIFFLGDTSTTEITDYAQRIVTALKGRLILNIGDVLPSNGDIYKTIELGRWVDGINKDIK